MSAGAWAHRDESVSHSPCLLGPRTCKSGGKAGEQTDYFNVKMSIGRGRKGYREEVRLNHTLRQLGFLGRRGDLGRGASSCEGLAA